MKKYTISVHINKVIDKLTQDTWQSFEKFQDAQEWLKAAEEDLKKEEWDN